MARGEIIVCGFDRIQISFYQSIHPFEYKEIWNISGDMLLQGVALVFFFEECILRKNIP